MGAEICKPSEEEFEDSSLWDFCGRKEENNKILKIITSQQVKTLCVHGAKKIGKSRVIKQVLLNDKLKDYICSCYVDFDLFSIETVTTADFIEFLKDFCTNVGIDEHLTECGQCQLCSENKACSVALDTVIIKFTKLKQKCLVCFDNADKIINSILQKEFLKFLGTVTDKRKNIKLLVTSTVRFSMQSRAQETYLLDKMDDSDLKELLVQVLQGSITIDSSTDHWLNVVAILCDGIPRCAETLGTILKEDDGLIEPIELVQLLLTNFLYTLNPELFPEEDRPAEKYRQELKKFAEISEAYEDTWLYNIADTMEGSEFTPKEGLKAIRSEGAQVTSATFKMDGLRKSINYSILQKRKKDDESLSMERLYKHLLLNAYNVIEENAGDGLNLKTYIGEKGLKLVKEEAKRIGLDLDNVKNVDALKIERELNRKDQHIKQGEACKSSGEENDDSGHSSIDDDQYDEDQIEHVKSDNRTNYGPSSEQVSKRKYDRFDSTSGPYAMSFKDPDDGLTLRPFASSNEENPVPSEVRPQKNTHSPQNSQATAIKDDIMKGHTNCQPVESETEEAYLRSNFNDASHGEATLSKSFPTTFLRTGLQAVENSDAKAKRERTTSGHQIYPTPFTRMGSKDYEDADIPNNYVNTTEASDSEKQDNPSKGDAQSTARYSNSSTDSGETRLSFEIKENNIEK